MAFFSEASIALRPAPSRRPPQFFDVFADSIIVCIFAAAKAEEASPASPGSLRWKLKGDGKLDFEFPNLEDDSYAHVSSVLVFSYLLASDFQLISISLTAIQRYK